MGLETGTYISDLVSTNPTASDAKSQGDDHIRLLKSTIKSTFPNVSGAVTPTHTELNYVDGVTSAIQTQIDTKGAKAGETWTGTHNFTGATVTAATQTAGDSSTKVATTAFVAATAFSSVLPAQAGANNKILQSDGANASWQSILKRDARTSNAILGVADNRNYIEVTTGGFTQTLTAAATLGDGWWVLYKNNDTSAVTLDADGAETIDGATTLIMYAGESRLIVCTGSTFHTTVVNGFTHTFSAGTTFTRPPHYKYFLLECWGGGGSGGKSTSGTGGGGGGGGAYNQRLVTASQLGASVVLTVGAGGVSQTSTSTDGNVGGDTSVGSLVVAYGGGGGDSNSYGGGGGGVLSAGSSAGQGGDPSDDYVGARATATAIAGSNSMGGAGGGGAGGGSAEKIGGYAGWGGGGGGAGNTGHGGAGGNSYYGGGGGGGGGNSAGAAGGTSVVAGAGGAGAFDASNATAGTTPSGGGGGSETGNSGAGGDGQIRITGIL